MRLSILSRNAGLYSTQRLVEAAQRRGHQVSVKDPLKYTIHIGAGATLEYLGDGQEYLGNDKRPDAVVTRIGASVTVYGLAVVRQFEEMGVVAVNGSQGIACSRDKFRAYQILAHHTMPLPPTVLVKRRPEILRAIDSVGGAPVVIKLLEGAQGSGVVLARDLSTAQAFIELLQTAKQNILVQKFVEEAKNSDIRALVVGDRVVAAMRRRSNHKDEFRSNIHLGGRAEPCELDPVAESLAVRAAQLLHLEVAGVDLIESKTGPLILEVNSSPGLEAIESVSGVDIANAIVERVESRAKSCA